MNAPSPPLIVPQADPGAGYRAAAAEIDRAVARVLASGWYILGAECSLFEKDFAAWQGQRCAVGVANGTDALALILRGLGIGPGASVVTVSHTAVATVAAIEIAGATPILVDIDPRHFTMDPAELSAVLASPPAGLPPIRAVIPVHLYGGMAEIEPIITAAHRHGVAVVEDCSQSHGAVWAGRKCGSFGVAAAFSLYPTKNLGALGDGGVVTTDDEALAERIAALRQYGWRERYVSDLPGVNSRLDELQAAILRVKLSRLDAANARRVAIASAYDEALADTPFAPPPRRPNTTHVFHQYVIRCPDRASVQARLRAAGIGTGVHYPVPIHLQPAYRGRIPLGPSACRETERAAGEVLSLPMFPELDDAQVERVCTALRGLC